MSLQDKKITDYEDNIKDLPDRIEGRAEWLKKKFDGRTDKEVKDKHNGLVDALDALEIEARVKSGDIKAIRVNADNQLEVSKDGVNFALASRSGHIVLVSDGSAMAQRRKMLFGEHLLVTDDAGADTTTVNVKPGLPPGSAIDCGTFTGVENPVEEHNYTPRSHQTMTLDGNVDGPVDTGTGQTLEEHMTNPYAHENITVDGNI